MIYGPLAFEAWMRKLGPSIWGAAILLAILWPIAIPPSYLIAKKILGDLPFFSPKFLGVFLSITFACSSIISIVYVFNVGEFHKLTDDEIFEEAIYADSVKYLSQVWDKVGHKQPSKGDPLLTALYAKSVSASLFLIEKRSDLDQFAVAVSPETSGDRPLHLASRIGLIEVMKKLLEKGVDPNLRDSEGRTPLHMLAGVNNGEEVILLHEKGANFDVVDDQGDTPLIALAKFNASGGQLQRYGELLIKFGVNPNAKNREGETALSYAAANGHYKLSELLKP